MASFLTYSNSGNTARWQPSQVALLGSCASGAQQGLLATLAKISQANQGWILLANAPAPLCRHTLQQAGINLARVIDAKQLSHQLVSTAKECANIAAVVCWKMCEGQLTTETYFNSNSVNDTGVNHGGYFSHTNRRTLQA